MSHIESLVGRNDMACHAIQAKVSEVAILPDPQMCKQAMRQSDASKWTESIELELEVFITPVMLPEGAVVVCTRLIFRRN